MVAGNGVGSVTVLGLILPRRSRFVWLLVIAMLVSLLSVAGQNTPAMAAVGTASISGTVQGQGTPNVDLAGVLVSARSTNGFYFRSGSDAYTGADGSYTISNLPAGTYTLSFQVVDSGPGMNYVSTYLGGKSAIAAGDRFTVGAGESVAGKNVVLAIGATISGHVDHPGNGSAGVQVYSAGNASDFNPGVQVDNSGNYTINRVGTGSFTLNFYGYGAASQYWNNKPTLDVANYFDVAAGQTITGKDAQLVAGGVITGNVQGLGSPNTVLGGVTVSAFLLSGGGTPSSSSFTDAEGNYTIPDLTAGTYSLSFSPRSDQSYQKQWWEDKATQATAVSFAVASGQVVSGMNAVLTPSTSISGNVTGQGTPNTNLQNVWVTAHLADGSSAGTSVTGADGGYTIRDLTAGSYTLSFTTYDGTHLSQWWSGKPSQSVADFFSVTAGQQVTGKDIVLPVGATISGNVTGAGSPNVTLQNVSVDAVDPAGNFVSSASTDVNGNYTVNGLPTGSYTLRFSTNGLDNFATEWWNGKTSPGTADFFSVTAGQQLMGKDIVLPVGATISGTITSTSGVRLDGTVAVYLAAGAGDTNATLVASSAEVGGSYSIPGLPAGSYKLGFTTDSTGFSLSGSLLPSDPYLSQWYQGKYSFGTAIPVVSTAGQAVGGINFVIENPTFADVSDPTYAFYNYIQWMSSSGVSTGTVQPSGKPLYRPSNAVSRQAMASFLYKLSGETFVAPTVTTFADVDSSATFFTAIEWMASKGISTGTVQPAGKPFYKPTDAVSRSAMALFLARYSHANISAAPTVASFADVPLDAPSAAAIKWMKDTGISTGTVQPSGLALYKPSDPVSRSAMAAFLYRMVHLVTAG